MREARWVWLGLALCGCQRTALPPPPVPPPPAVTVPEGCLSNLSGEWVHGDDSSFRYRAEDDGGALRLTVVGVEEPRPRFRPRRFRDAGPEPDAGESDAGAPQAAGDAGPPAVQVLLARTPHGFIGETRLTVQHPNGRACEAVFPAEVVDCRDGGLALLAVPAVTFDAECRQAPEKAAEALPHRLRRP
jgi:hypothetical protein